MKKEHPWQIPLLERLQERLQAVVLSLEELFCKKHLVTAASIFGKKNTQENKMMSD